jgi:SNF2 family DNA or RNA helicase
MTMRAFAELNEQGTKINVHFKFDPDAKDAVKAIPGARFVGRDKGGPFWTLPLDLDSGRQLRDVFGPGLTLGNALKAWGRTQLRGERRLGAVAGADDAVLRSVPSEAAEWLRPYQRADVAMMAVKNVLNANQPGVGKTVEVIYATREAGLNGAHLVVAPITLHKDPWADELKQHHPEARVFWGTTPRERQQAVTDALAAIDAGEQNVWLVVNPEMVRVKRDADNGLPVLSRDHKGGEYTAKDPEQARLFEVRWDSLTLDEFHKYGLGANRNTLFARGVQALGRNATRKYALSGTPMGGKPVRLWGVLHFIEPEKYPGKWKWAQRWLLNADGDGPVDPGAGTGIGRLQPGIEAEFWRAHRSHMIRRARAEALPGLPPKVTINVPVGMTASQRKVYDRFERSAEVVVNGGVIAAEGVLAEFARLKQLANARCEIADDGETVIPTEDSGKLPILIDRLDTYGVRKDDPEPGARAIVASESKRMVEMVARSLAREGLNVKLLTGAVTGADRNAVIDWYKEDVEEARTLVMTTQTGGVGLNLGMTGSIHILDETWNPDDQEQLEDRGMRNRTTPLIVLYYRTEDSIQEYIWDVTRGKQVDNDAILKIRERMKARAEA